MPPANSAVGLAPSDWLLAFLAAKERGQDYDEEAYQSALRTAVDALPEREREVIELAYFEGLSQSEVAERLSLPLGTVKTRMRLGMQKLRDAWLKE